MSRLLGACCLEAVRFPAGAEWLIGEFPAEVQWLPGLALDRDNPRVLRTATRLSCYGRRTGNVLQAPRLRALLADVDELRDLSGRRGVYCYTPYYSDMRELM